MPAAKPPPRPTSFVLPEEPVGDEAILITSPRRIQLLAAALEYALAEGFLGEHCGTGVSKDRAILEDLEGQLVESVCTLQEHFQPTLLGGHL